MTVTVLFPRARPVGPRPSITSRNRPRAGPGHQKRTHPNTLSTWPTCRWTCATVFTTKMR